MMSTKITTAQPINRVMVRGDMGCDRIRRESRRHPRQSKANRSVLQGRILILPLERGRSPSAARLSVEVEWRIPEPLHRLYCCGPGRFAVRRWRCQDAPVLQRVPASCRNAGGWRWLETEIRFGDTGLRLVAIRSPLRGSPWRADTKQIRRKNNWVLLPSEH